MACIRSIYIAASTASRRRLSSSASSSSFLLRRSSISSSRFRYHSSTPSPPSGFPVPPSSPSSRSSGPSDPSKAMIIPITAMYLPRRIEFWHVYRLAFADCAITTQANSAIIQIGGDTSVFDSPDASPPALDPSCGFIVFFKYGAVVFYNVDQSQRLRCLEAVDRTSPVPSSSEARSEEYALEVGQKAGSGASDYCKVTCDSISMPEINVNTLRVISQVLAQTVALEHFENKVQAMLEAFRGMNAKIEQTGDLHLEKKNKLFKLTAANNTILTDVISQLKVLDRSDTAWKYGGYTERMWDALRDEFEIPERFKAVDFKIDLIQNNTKFFMEVLHNQKSDKLEWAIIILLLFEILLCGYDIFERYSLRKLKEALTGRGDGDGDDSSDDEDL